MSKILCPTPGCGKLLMHDICDNVKVASSSCFDYSADCGKTQYGINDKEGYFTPSDVMLQIKCRGCHKKPFVYKEK